MAPALLVVVALGKLKQIFLTFRHSEYCLQSRMVSYLEFQIVFE